MFDPKLVGRIEGGALELLGYRNQIEEWTAPHDLDVQ